MPVIALDRPNYVGSSPLRATTRSSSPTRRSSSDAIGDDLGASTAARHPGVVLVAHSIGGAVATAIAAIAAVMAAAGPRDLG